MHSSFTIFQNNLRYVRDLHALHAYLSQTLKLPNDLSDLLRAEWMYAVSAFDKLLHDLIRVGMIESYLGVRPKTRKFTSFPVSLDTVDSIQTATVPPAEYYLEQEIIEKHKTLSFQDPDKVADGLSLIWDEDHKWAKISPPLGMTEKDVRTTLKAVVARRNQIVHEADLNLFTGLRNPISDGDTLTAINFIDTLATSIYNNVK